MVTITNEIYLHSCIGYLPAAHLCIMSCMVYFYTTKEYDFSRISKRTREMSFFKYWLSKWLYKEKKIPCAFIGYKTSKLCFSDLRQKISVVALFRRKIF